MSKETELLERWAAEKMAYECFGNYLIQSTRNLLEPLIRPKSVDYFIKAPVSPRLKLDPGLVEKAFYRGKNYKNPYDDITDKVGIRFVVLLGRDIAKVEEALRSINNLTLSKDRDYEAEQSRNPIEFDYAAIHYVCSSNIDIDFEGVTIPAGTPCEVQIKTLLQHAYSELTHDTIYKPQVQATPAMQRDAAKSMALLEATNDYFEKVADSVAEVIGSFREITNSLSVVYRERVGFEPSPSRLEGLLLDGYESSVDQDYVREIDTLLDNNAFLLERIKERVAEGNPIFKQPSIFLVYLDIFKRKHLAIDRWTLTPNEMEPLLNDLGESMF